MRTSLPILCPLLALLLRTVPAGVADVPEGLWYPLPTASPEGRSMTVDKDGISWKDGLRSRGWFAPLADGRTAFIPDGHRDRPSGYRLVRRRNLYPSLPQDAQPAPDGSAVSSKL